MIAMDIVTIKNEEQFENGWKYTVHVGPPGDTQEYLVTVDWDYWQELTTGKEAPADLVRRSFEFLLAREPRESILERFDLRVINSFFPEYEEEIRRR